MIEIFGFLAISRRFNRMRYNNYQTIDVSSLAFTSQLVITNTNNLFFSLCLHWVTFPSPHLPHQTTDSHPHTHYCISSEEDGRKSLKSQLVQWYEVTYYNSSLVVEEMWTEDICDNEYGPLYRIRVLCSFNCLLYTQGVLRMKYTLLFFFWMAKIIFGPFVHFFKRQVRYSTNSA